MLTRATDLITLKFPQERIQSKKKTREKALGDTDVLGRGRRTLHEGTLQRPEWQEAN